MMTEIEKVIDCHAHLALPDFEADRRAVLERAREAGVYRVIVVAEDLRDSLQVLEVCRQHPQMLPCVGIHPDRWAEDRQPPCESSIESLRAMAYQNRDCIVGIGEVGLDYWQVKSPARRALQLDALERMAHLALELDLPLNVHSRSAGHYTLDALAAFGVRRVLMHAFDGKALYAQRAAEKYGWLFSVPPSVVRSVQKQKLVRMLPLTSLALESDSPVLGPVRDQRNEPANLHHTISYISKARGMAEEQVRATTTRNALGLFGRL